jgi:folate-binding protein YgfZ
MTSPSPLIDLLAASDASFISYADAAAVVETFAHPELEYASIRKSAGIIDLPHRATLRATGADRLDFLNRMLTQQLADVDPWSARRSFLTNRQGRLVADLTVVHLPEETLLDVDMLASGPTLELLNQFLFSEDAALEDATASLHRVAIHGPTALPLLTTLAEGEAGAPALDTLGEAQATRVRLGERAVIVHRHDAAGVPGYVLTVRASDAVAVYTAITAIGVEPEHDHVEAKDRAAPAHPFKLRQIGWHALNIARIEAGTPLFNIDFGPGNLPAETGVLDDRVSFTKGCYPGQEVVARMRNLGHPKQTLVALRVEQDGEGEGGGGGGEGVEAQPQTGASIFEAGAGEDARAVGAITSSAHAPMLSSAIVCFGQVKWSVAERAGESVEIETRGAVNGGSGGRVRATIQRSLRFLSARE